MGMDTDDQPSDELDASPDVIDDAFLALRERDRRFALYYLLEHETASLSEVADVVTGWLYATEEGVVGSERRNKRYLTLLHVHVPTLVDAGIVDHDEEAGTLSLAPCPESVRELARRACAQETGP